MERWEAQRDLHVVQTFRFVGLRNPLQLPVAKVRPMLDVPCIGNVEQAIRICVGHLAAVRHHNDVILT